MKLNQSQCIKVINEIATKAAELHEKVSIAIVDSGGHLLAFSRMDSAALITVDTAIGKAYTAAMMQANSSVLHDITQPGQPLAGFQAMTLQPRPLVPFAGGVIVIDDEAIVGGIGVSGASSSQTDESIALSALNTLQLG